MKKVAAGFLLFVLVRHFHFISVQDNSVRLLLRENESLWADIPTLYFLTENQAVRTYMMWRGKKTKFLNNDASLSDLPRPFMLYAAKEYATVYYPSRDTFSIRNEYLSVVREASHTP